MLCAEAGYYAAAFWAYAQEVHAAVGVLELCQSNPHLKEICKKIQHRYVQENEGTPAH